MRKTLLIAAVCCVLLTAACGSSSEPEATATPTATTTPTEQPTPEPTRKPTPEPTEVPTEVPQRPEAVGKSNKSVSSLNESFRINNVRNDVTGKWRISSITAPVHFEEYALSYYNTYYNDGEVHWIVNFTTKTTTSLTCLNGVIFLDVHEYVDNEEHDAKALGCGTTLASFAIYPDNGDIEHLK